MGVLKASYPDTATNSWQAVGAYSDSLWTTIGVTAYALCAG
jgi:hypothetical protein